jgi:hypothetical protein
MKETVGFIVAAVVALYANWTTMGVDNERQAMDRIKNSQGLLIRSGADE